VSLSRDQREYGEGNTRAERFNAANPIGTPVRYWPGVRDGEGRESVTRSPAWALLSGQAIVCVEGYAGGIALTHVEVTSHANSVEEQQ
jgi:hypothetical protein